MKHGAHPSRLERARLRVRVWVFMLSHPRFVWRLWAAQRARRAGRL